MGVQNPHTNNEDKIENNINALGSINNKRA